MSEPPCVRMRTGGWLVRHLSPTNNSPISNHFPLSLPAKTSPSTVSSTHRKNYAHDACRKQPPHPPISNPQTKQRGKRPWLRFCKSSIGASKQRVIDLESGNGFRSAHGPSVRFLHSSGSGANARCPLLSIRFHAPRFVRTSWSL